MSLFSKVSLWWANRVIQKRFRYPGLAEINKAIFAIEEEIVDRSKFSHQLEHYVKAQEVPEKDRDTALIPYYFDLERFVIEHQPPVTKRPLTKEQIRTKIKERAELPQMNELFRLVFLPDNEQADYLLIIGIVEMLNFLLSSLGHAQLSALVKLYAGNTPLSLIVVEDDGVTFTEVHKKMAELSLAEVVTAYRNFYVGLFEEIEKLFGASAALTLITASRTKIEKLYDGDLASLFINTLPAKALGK